MLILFSCLGGIGEKKTLGKDETSCFPRLLGGCGSSLSLEGRGGEVERNKRSVVVVG